MSVNARSKQTVKLFVFSAAFFTDDVESNTQLLMEMYAREKSYEEYRRTGVHRIQLDIPDKTEELKLVAFYKDDEQGSSYAETTA